MNHSSIRAFLTPRLGIMLPLGFASGLPLALTGGTLQAWLTEAGLDLTTIGLFAAGLLGLGFLRRRRTTGKRRFKRSRESAFS